MAISAVEQYALCEVLFRVAIQIRSFPDIDRQVVWGMMEATHNIPLYLRSGRPELQTQVQWDLSNFDKRFGGLPHSLSLREIYDEAIEVFNRQGNA